MRFVHVEKMTMRGGDAGGILPTMLQQQQAVVDQLIDRALPDNAHNSTHIRFLFDSWSVRQQLRQRGRQQRLDLLESANGSRRGDRMSTRMNSRHECASRMT